MSLPQFAIRLINIQQPRQRISPHIADMARTIKAVLKKCSHTHTHEKKEIKDSQEKNKKRKTEGKRWCYNTGGCILF